MSKVKTGIVLMLVLLAVAGRAYAAGVSVPSGAALSLNTASLSMPGDIAIAGTLQSSTGAITVYGNWSNTGSFTPGSGDVTFTGTSNHAVSGSTGFYNLTCSYAGSRFTFEAGMTQTITSALTMTGASGNLITLRSSAGGTQWKINPQGTRNVSWVDVQDSSNISGTLINPTNWTDSGNNSSWVSSGGGDEGGGGGGGGSGGGLKLTVQSTSPSDGATGVSADAAISATFSLLMNGATLDSSTFKVSVGTHTTVSGDVATSGYSATFTPSVNLDYDTTYTATITRGASAANAAGTALDSSYSWSFTTTSEPSPTPTSGVTPSPTASATPAPTQTVTATPTPSATPLPTPSPPSALRLSKEVAYLSGDTIVATVTDG